MMERNRRTAPALQPLRDFSIPPLSCDRLPNGMEIWWKNTEAKGLVRMDVMVRAGALFQSRPMLATLANALLKEGSMHRNSEQIAERLDYYGAFVYYSCGMEYACINLCTPKSCFRETMSLLKEIFREPAFPEKELTIALEQRYQNWQIEKEKVQVLATREMNRLLFGKNHPYGRILQEDDFKNFDASLLRNFHQNYYASDNTLLVLTGDVCPEDLELVRSGWGEDSWGESQGQDCVPAPAQALPPQKYFVPKADCLQAALRFSIPLVGQSHPDFIGLKVLNVILGGYFGSRLMRHLREEKGYTYGIASSHTVYRDMSYMDISTQTAIEYVDALAEGVYAEIRCLQEELVSDEEMLLVRNYLSGEYARMIDGPFALSDLFMTSRSVGEDISSYEKQMKVIQQITPMEIRALAQKHLSIENFYEVRVGGCKEEK